MHQLIGSFFMLENIQLVPHGFEPCDIVSVENESSIRSWTLSVILQKILQIFQAY